MTHALLDRFRLSVAERKLVVYGVSVWREGQSPVTHRWRSDDRECIYSVSKTFTALAVGLCVDEGRFSLDDRALDFFPEFKDNAAEGAERATIRDLLHMASGHKGYATDDRDRDDWLARFFGLPHPMPAGSAFRYNNEGPYVLSRIVEKVSGLTLRDYLVPRLFDPLDIPNPTWEACPRGHTSGGSGLYLRTDEIARLGMLLLGGGVYNGARVVSDRFVRAMSTDVIDSRGWGGGDPEAGAGYGYFVWRCSRPETFRADGLYGQYAMVFEDLRTVVAITAHVERNQHDLVRLVYDDILPRLA